MFLDHLAAEYGCQSLSYFWHTGQLFRIYSDLLKNGSPVNEDLMDELATRFDSRRVKCDKTFHFYGRRQ